MQSALFGHAAVDILAASKALRAVVDAARVDAAVEDAMAQSWLGRVVWRVIFRGARPIKYDYLQGSPLRADQQSPPLSSVTATSPSSGVIAQSAAVSVRDRDMATTKVLLGAISSHHLTFLIFTPCLCLDPAPLSPPPSSLNPTMHPTTMLFHVFALVALAVIPSVTANSKPSGYLAKRADAAAERRAAPSPYIRRGPAPPPAPSGYIRKRDEQSQQVIGNSQETVSQFLCPKPLRVCPISAETHPTNLEQWIHDGFECVDDREDLTSCGGCGLSDSKYDCTAIEGAVGVSCVIGECRVDSCAKGFTVALDHKACLKTD